MPKRPSAITIGPGSRIISADKFGDVHALPLIPSDSPAPANSTLRTAQKPVFKPAANQLTVHSKRNMRALNSQQVQIDRAQKKLESGEGKDEAKPDGTDFELSLLLGHVSVLTSVVLGENRGRPVIVTADRDEHIRVSRYIPQAHVIEGFCMGHREFVSSIVIPEARGEILVSGGGDEELYVWNWQTCSLLSKASVLSLAQEIVPETAKVAVSKLVPFDYSSDSGTRTFILAICER